MLVPPHPVGSGRTTNLLQTFVVVALWIAFTLTILILSFRKATN